jgi:hypothetical protein
MLGLAAVILCTYSRVLVKGTVNGADNTAGREENRSSGLKE